MHCWLSPGGDWCVDGSQKSLDKKVVANEPEEAWRGLRCDAIKLLKAQLPYCHEFPLSQPLSLRNKGRHVLRKPSLSSTGSSKLVCCHLDTVFLAVGPVWDLDHTAAELQGHQRPEQGKGGETLTVAWEKGWPRELGCRSFPGMQLIILYCQATMTVLVLLENRWPAS